MINKNAYIMVKEVKQFKNYVLRSHTKVIIQHVAIRYAFIQKELEKSEETR